MMRRITGAAYLLVAIIALGVAPAAAHLDKYVFVPNRDSADVAMIDTETDRVVARIKVGNAPHQIVISKSLGKLVTANTRDNSVTIVDIATRRAQATIALGAAPEHMALAPDGRTLAVGNIAGGTVSLVSLTENRETARIAGLFKPHNLTFNTDGSLLYVANLGAGHVSVIDVATRRIVRDIAIGGPRMVATANGTGLDAYQGIVDVTPTLDGRLGFAAHGESDSVTVLDLKSMRRLATIDVGDRPWRAYVTADGANMMVPNNGDATLSVISATTLKNVATLSSGPDVTGINSDATGRTAFVLSRGAGKALIVDLATMKRAGEIVLPGHPETGVTTLDGRKLYVALADTNSVAVIDTKTRRLIRTIKNVGKGPWGATIAGAANYCH